MNIKLFSIVHLSVCVFKKNRKYIFTDTIKKECYSAALYLKNTAATVLYLQ